MAITMHEPTASGDHAASHSKVLFEVDEYTPGIAMLSSNKD